MALVAWDKVCRAKDQGGLSVLKLHIQNKALLLKNLHKFYSRMDVPWVNLIWNSYYSDSMLPGQQLEGSFWWKAHLILIDFYKGMAKCNLGDGKSVYFWTDLWNEKCLHKKLPHLASYARHANTTVNEAIQNEFLEDLFQLPLSQQAYEEFLELQIICDEAKERIALRNKDQWSYIWGSDEFYCKKAYKVLQGEIIVIPHFKWIWESSCQAKHKFFFWLLLLDRLNTRNLLARKNFNLQSYLCATLQCPREETLIHLFWTCPFAAQCWDYVCPQRTRNLSVIEIK